MLKSTGPNTEPSGTSEIILSQAVNLLFTRPRCRLFTK